MAIREQVRSGGRSARIQLAVHDAVDALSAESDRDALNIPLIAARAGVPPSTIYRRWGTLAELLADVAVKQMRPAAVPTDTGSTFGDLQNWVDQYLEDMSSPVGVTMLRDVLSSPVDARTAGQCCAYTTEQLEILSSRAIARGEPPLAIDEILDHVVAPIIYRILFGGRAVDLAFGRSLVSRALSGRSGG